MPPMAHRRASTVDKNDVPSVVMETFDAQNIIAEATEEYDATAAALSRLTVASQSSPILSQESNEYEVITSSPSSAKRNSDYFDKPLAESNLKRLRRESIKPAFLDVSRSLEYTSSSTSAPKTSRCTSSPVLSADTRKRSQSVPNRIVTDIYQQQLNSAIQNRMPSYSAEPELFRFPQTVPSLVLVTPPISQSSLRELELSEIYKNAQLRHDIVHDPNLQFRPNFDGLRGSNKRLEASKYWHCIAKELDLVKQMTPEMRQRSRLTVMFSEMRDILLSLVPVTEKAQIAPRFDPELLLQELHHGLFDPSSFASYLSSVIKRHCAPMRDDPVDKMLSHIRASTSTLRFTDGLRQIFDILEMMKLDVANHQLRSLRQHLLETSIEFERSWFARKFEKKVYSRKESMMWMAELCSGPSVDFRKAFTDGIVKFVTSSGSQCIIPSTFGFDQSRICMLARDLREIVSINLTLLLARQLAGTAQGRLNVTTLKAELWAIMTDVPYHAYRWASMVPALALHVCQRIAQCKQPSKECTLPARAEITFAGNWMTKHLVDTSPLYQMVESRIAESMKTVLYHDLTVTSVNGSRLTHPSLVMSTGEACETEIRSIAGRLSTVAEFHWKVHGLSYVKWYTNSQKMEEKALRLQEEI